MADEHIRKYLPTAADILRRTDEDAAKKRLERALDNPDLDAALADMKARGKEGEDPLYYEVKQEKEGPEAAAGAPGQAAAPAPVTAPVTVPAAGPAVSRPRTELKPPHSAHSRRRLATAATIALAVMAVVTPALLVAVLKQPATTNHEAGAAANTVRVAATQQSAPAVGGASVPAAPSAVAPAPGQTADAASNSAAVPPAPGKPASPKVAPSSGKAPNPAGMTPNVPNPDDESEDFFR